MYPSLCSSLINCRTRSSSSLLRGCNSQLITPWVLKCKAFFLFLAFLWVEGGKKRVSEDVMVLPCVSYEESHSLFFISSFDPKPAVLSDLSLLVFCSI